MPTAVAVFGDKMLVITGHANALHIVRRAKTDQRALAMMEGKGGLFFNRLQHWAIGAFLTGHSPGFHVAELAVDAHRTEQIRRSHLFINALVQLCLGDWTIEMLGDAGLEKSDDGKWGFLLQTGRPRATVGTQLVYFLVEGDQFTVQVVESPQAKIAVPE
ncbi:hypothetical protein D3C73_1310970 [compost metagenome]